MLGLPPIPRSKRIAPGTIGTLPALVSALRQVKQLSFCGETVPLESQEVRERFEKQLLLALWNRPQVLLWLKRSQRYFPRIEALLQANGMPDDRRHYPRFSAISSAIYEDLGIAEPGSPGRDRARPRTGLT